MRAPAPYLGAFADSVGPLYSPSAAGCFGCLEHRLREELGDRHDLLVDALAAKRSWRYPAFVSGPLTVAHLMTTEIVLHLTGAAPPSTVGGSCASSIRAPCWSRSPDIRPVTVPRGKRWRPQRQDRLSGHRPDPTRPEPSEQTSRQSEAS